ncbi:MAG: DUF3829 domain-containing protein [Janthinobacterium lividum]
MKQRLLAALSVAALATPALAQTPDAAPVGIGACDTFLAAYARCLASPGVPDATRSGLQQSLAAMRTTYRDAGARSQEARDSIRQQCASAHDMVRTRMIEALKCDFPAASAMPVAADLPLPAPAAPQPVATPPTSPAEDTEAKVNEYTAVQNHIVESHPMARELADHLTNNERVLRLGTKLGANAWYLFGIGDFDHIVEELQHAIALPGAVPEVDPKAAELLAALRTVNPTIKELAHYQTTREFKEDDYKLARERQPALVSGMRAAIDASEAFGTALFDRRMAIDERRLAALPADSLAQGLLAASLSTRRLTRRYDALRRPADVAPFLAVVADVVAANRKLAATADALSPKPDSSCADYSEALDRLVGHGRDMARDVRTGGDPSQPAELFATAYNSSIDAHVRCMKREPRARY